jgi:hypothetical protein
MKKRRFNHWAYLNPEGMKDWEQRARARNNRSIFLQTKSNDTKRFVWGRQTAFEDVLAGDISKYSHDEFMQKISIILPRYWIAAGLDFIFDG